MPQESPASGAHRGRGLGLRGKPQTRAEATRDCPVPISVLWCTPAPSSPNLWRPRPSALCGSCRRRALVERAALRGAAPWFSQAARSYYAGSVQRPVPATRPSSATSSSALASAPRSRHPRSRDHPIASLMALIKARSHRVTVVSCGQPNTVIKSTINQFCIQRRVGLEASYSELAGTVGAYADHVRFSVTSS